ncbi:autotransporter domain-containing protein [Roseococcus sp. SYP-B2431]|nr:autotransporter domain-containing protein [Roseococcus sp. SYP-B2431]
MGNNVGLTIEAAVSGGGSGMTQGHALQLTGDSSLTLLPGWSLNGGISIGGATTILSSVELPNVISGPGNLVIAGDLILTGNNTYTGGTSIGPGFSLQLGDGTVGAAAASLGSGAVTNDGTLTFFSVIRPLFESSQEKVVANAIGGAGSVVVRGDPGGQSDILVLTANNTYSGGTTIHTGAILQLGNGGATGSAGSGAILNNGTLTVRRSGTLTIDAPISGTGYVEHFGPGTLVVGGNNTYADATYVGGGTLTVNGSIAASSGLRVDSGATVSGIGTLPATVIDSGGTIAPGNSVGTLTVNGNLTVASGATMAMEVRGGAADRINVSGTAQLDGTIRLIPLGGNYSFNAPYTLLTAASVVGSPTLSTQGSFGAGVTTVLSVSPTHVKLTLTPAPLLLPPSPLQISPLPPGVGETPVVRVATGLPGPLPANIRSTAGALDIARAAGGNLQPFFNVYNQPSATISQAVNQLSGEVGTTTTGMGLIAGQQFLGSMLNPFGYGRDTLMGSRIAPDGSADGDDMASGPPRPRYAMWGQATGAYSRVAGDGSAGSATRSARGAGFAMGLDIALGSQSMVGIAAGAGETSASLSGGLGRANSWTGQLGVFGRTRLDTAAGGFTLAGAAAVSFLQTDTKRTQYFLNSAEQRASADSRVYSFRLEGRHDGMRRPGIAIQPLAAIQAQVVDSDGYSERSSAPGTPTGVTVRSATNSTVRTELGVQADFTLPMGTRLVRGFGRAAWGHYLMREQTSAVALQAFPGNGFTVQGARPDADSAILAAGIETEIAPRWTLGARVDSELSSRVREVAGTVRVRYAF